MQMPESQQIRLTRHSFQRRRRRQRAPTDDEPPILKTSFHYPQHRKGKRHSLAPTLCCVCLCCLLFRSFPHRFAHARGARRSNAAGIPQNGERPNGQHRQLCKRIPIDPSTINRSTPRPPTQSTGAHETHGTASELSAGALRSTSHQQKGTTYHPHRSIWP